MTIPYTFAGATTAIPLAQLDANFASPITLGNVAMTLSNTYTSIGNLTLTNVTISSASGLSANTVAYANASGVLGGSANMVFDGSTLTTLNTAYTGTLTGGTGVINIGSNQIYKDSSGRLGLGVVPKSWAIGGSVIQIAGRGYWGATTGQETDFGLNAYYDGSWKYLSANPASNYSQQNGAHIWQVVLSGAQDSVFSWNSAMVLNNTGNLLIGSTTNYGPKIYAASGGAVSPATSGNMTTGYLFATGDGSQGLNFGQDSNGTWYNSAYVNNAGVALNHRWYIGGTEAMRIDTSGNLRIGTTGNLSTEKLTVVTSTASVASFFRNSHATSGDTTLGLWIDSAKDTNSYILSCINNNQSGNGQVCNIYANGNIQNINNSYGAISDAKLKENIIDATPKLDDLMKVKVRNYNLIGDTNKQIGVVAQELETVFAGLVEETNDTDREGNVLGTTTKSVKYSVFVPMLIKAVQEQQALITNLTTRLTALENK